MPDFTPRSSFVSSPRQSGWTAASITPRATTLVRDFSPAPSPAVATPPTIPATPAITPDDLKTTPQALNDPSLGSRQYTSVPGGKANVLAQTSVYETPNAPAFLANQVAALNSQQAARKQFQDQLINQLLGLVGSNNPNAYLYAGALQAAVAQPGAGGFAPVQNPLIGQGYNAASQASAKFQTAQTDILNKPAQIQSQIDNLKQRRKFYEGVYGNLGGPNSDVSKIDQQIFDLQNQLSGAQNLATRAAGASSGWSSPVIPRY